LKLTKDENKQEFGFKKFSFRIDEKHQMKAIWALINLYEHKIRTPVQEIISNARDAHREVGKPDHTFKVKITEDKFIVRDFGSGIDPEKAQNIFCSIGESTKTNDNTQTGGFGIGAKSPLAYAKQFEVYSYVNGIEYHYVIAKNGEMLDMNLISEESSDKPTGTKVIVPIKDNKGYYSFSTSDKDKFIQSVQRTCMFWDKKPEFNHEHKYIDVLMVNGLDRTGYYASKSQSHNYAVVDGIPYDIKLSGYNKVFFFNTGEIRLHETRERLADNDIDYNYNMEIISKKYEVLSNYFSSDKIEYYLDHDNLFDSFRYLSKYNVPFKYKLKDFTFYNNRVFNELGDFNVYTSYKTSRYPYKQKYAKSKTKSLKLDTEVYYNDLEESQSKVSRRVKNYIQQFVDNNTDKEVIVLDSKYLAEKFGAKNVSDLVIPKIKKSGNVKKNEEITITEILISKWVNNSYQNRIYSTIENVNCNYLYIQFNENVCDNMVKFLSKKGYTVCKLSKDSIKKVKGIEKFTDYTEFVTNYKPTNEEKMKVYKDRAMTSTYNVNNTEVTDKDMVRHNELCKIYNKPCCDYNIPKEVWTTEMKSELEKISSNNDQIKLLRESLDKRYPMLGVDKEANTEYINALYHYRKNLHGLK
jgi:hypothetical protein